MHRISSVALIGLGAVGSFVAPRISKAVGSENFYIIAEDKRKQRLEEKGVVINGEKFLCNIKTPEDKKTVDLVIIAVKNYNLDEAVSHIKNSVGKDTIILSLLNGIESEEKIKKALKTQNVLYSFIKVSAEIKNGSVNYDPQKGRVYFGEIYNNFHSENVDLVENLFERAEINYKIPRDMLHAMWEKFMINVSENQVCAALGVPYGAFSSSRYANEMRIDAAREVIALANKMGILLTEDDLTAHQALLDSLPFENKPSTLQDIERKQKTEIESFAGAVIRLGKKYGVPVPTNKFLYKCIKVLEEKNEGKIAGI